jgi:hypothetical protein
LCAVFAGHRRGHLKVCSRIESGDILAAAHILPDLQIISGGV